MSTQGIISLALQVVGAAMVVAGLYRRDPVAQRALQSATLRAEAQLRRLFRRPRHHTLEVHDAVHASSAMSAELSRHPGARETDAPTEERLDWVERAVDLAFDEINSEQDARRKGDKELADGLGAVERQQAIDRDDLKGLIDEARVPERMEWFGAVLLVVGLIGSTIDGILP